MERIAFITDIHLDEEFPQKHDVNAKQNWERIIVDLENRGVDKIIFGGDIGEASAHAWFFETLKPFSFHVILGNHDSYDSVMEHYSRGDDPKELFYHVEHDSFRFLFLDSSAEEISETQLRWLEEKIDSDKPILLFIHHPIIAVNSLIDQMHPLKNREAVKSVLHKSSQEIFLFCGHYHMNDESHEGNVRQLITQAASFQVGKSLDRIKIGASTFGYRMIEVGKGSVQTKLVSFKNENYPDVLGNDRNATPRT